MLLVGLTAALATWISLDFRFGGLGRQIELPRIVRPDDLRCRRADAVGRGGGHGIQQRRGDGGPAGNTPRWDWVGWCARRPAGRNCPPIARPLGSIAASS